MIEGVRDPRWVRPPSQKIEEPRPAPNRDIIAMLRRLLYPVAPDPARKQAARRAAKGAARAPITKPRQSAKDAYEAYLKTARESRKHAVRAVRASETTAAGADERKHDCCENLTLVQYRYTKEIDIVNDEMGYGERIQERFWQLNGGRTSQVSLVSQRVKSGRQPLK